MNCRKCGRELTAKNLRGRHRLLAGDSTKAEDVARVMNGEKAAMAFTDPPYALFGNSTGVGDIADDKMVLPFFRVLLDNLKNNTKKYGHIYVCCDWHGAFSILRCAKEIELPPKNLIVWDKQSPGLGSSYTMTYELIWFFSNAPPRRTTMKTDRGERIVQGISNIFRFPRIQPDEREHNAEKPVEMVKVPIGASSDEGDLVIDFFLGSGTTLIAAETLKRRCVGLEIDPRYCDVVVRRWQNLTGKTAILESTGQTFAAVSAARA